MVKPLNNYLTMKKLHLKKSMLLTLLLLPLSLLYAQSEEEMNAWMEFTKPTEKHKFLEKFAGDWTYESSMWMDPSQPAMKSSGETNSEMIMGGRYLQSKHKGESMDMPFEGMSMMAFDKAENKFVSTWVDNMGTGIMVFHGQMDEAGNVIEMEADYINPMTKQKEKHKIVETIIDDKNHKMEYFVIAPGKEEFKMMEIMYAKK